MIGRVIRDKEGAALVFGKYGTGKTTLMRRVFSELRDRNGEFQVGVIENAGHCPTEFQLAGEIIESFGRKSRSDNRKGRYDQIKNLMFENYKQGVTSVLLIDEAQELPAKVLESLRGYLNFETSNHKVIQILLFALPKIRRKLQYAKTLRNRLVFTELSEMSQTEMIEMLRWRFTQAGGTGFPFDEPALERLYELTKGHPRSTCGVAQLAIEVAGLRDRRVTAEIINQVKGKRFL